MKPLDFSLSNCKYAEHQEEYEMLPVFKDEEGTVVSCWKLSWVERLKIFCFGKLWLMQMTFHEPLQPQLPTVDYPLAEQESR